MPKDKKMFLKVFVSKKGNKCFALCVDLGYAIKFLNFDINTIAEVMGLPVGALYEKAEGEYEV